MDRDISVSTRGANDRTSSLFLKNGSQKEIIDSRRSCIIPPPSCAITFHPGQVCFFARFGKIGTPGVRRYRGIYNHPISSSLSLSAAANFNSTWFYVFLNSLLKRHYAHRGPKPKISTQFFFFFFSVMTLSHFCVHRNPNSALFGWSIKALIHTWLTVAIIAFYAPADGRRMGLSLGTLVTAARDLDFSRPAF